MSSITSTLEISNEIIGNMWWARNDVCCFCRFMHQNVQQNQLTSATIASPQRTPSGEIAFSEMSHRAAVWHTAGSTDGHIGAA